MRGMAFSTVRPTGALSSGSIFCRGTTVPQLLASCPAYHLLNCFFYLIYILPCFCPQDRAVKPSSLKALKTVQIALQATMTRYFLLQEPGPMLTTWTCCTVFIKNQGARQRRFAAPAPDPKQNGWCLAASLIEQVVRRSVQNNEKGQNKILKNYGKFLLSSLLYREEGRK